MESEIIVVDNNSTDGSRTLLAPRFPAVTFIWNNNNVGFAKANNQAVGLAKGEYILFLNPDTIVAEDCFEKCILFLLKNESAGALGIRMIDGSGNFLKESKRAFPSPLTSLFKLTGLTALFPHSAIFAKYYLGHLSENEDHEIDVLAGAFMMIPQRVLALTGNFDERFFMYGEDVDLSYRIQQTGLKNFYFSGSTIIHFKGESTQKGSLKNIRLFYKAMSLFVTKQYSGGKAGLFVFFIQIAIGVRAVVAAINVFFQRLGRSVLKKRPGSGNDEKGSQAIIVSNEKDFKFITDLLQKTGSYEKILGRVNYEKDEKDSVLGHVQQLPELIKKYGANQIVFCESEISFKEMINCIQRLPKSIQNKFHASGSCSIVSSNSKDIQGEFMADKNADINAGSNPK